MKCLQSGRLNGDMLWKDVMVKEIRICPACINSFVDIHGVEKLGDEVEALRDKEVKKSLCDEHTSKSLFTELRLALILTESIFKD